MYAKIVCGDRTKLKNVLETSSKSHLFYLQKEVLKQVNSRKTNWLHLFLSMTTTMYLSYETGTSTEDSKGLLSTVLESVLKRQMVFKNLQKSFSINSKERLWCEQRIVSLYGTTGSFWNRFANVDV
jgi:hypothetical protein